MTCDNFCRLKASTTSSLVGFRGALYDGETQDQLAQVLEQCAQFRTSVRLILRGGEPSDDAGLTLRGVVGYRGLPARPLLFREGWPTQLVATSRILRVEDAEGQILFEHPHCCGLLEDLADEDGLIFSPGANFA
jgi:hypothetical protein